MEYRKKCLFRNTNKESIEEATAMESLWAYIYGTDEKKKSGRYRVRITKLDQNDMERMGMIFEEGVELPVASFGIQATLDIWHAEKGWLPTLDWVGDPNLPTLEIEKQINQQVRSFLTGISLDQDFQFDFPVVPPKKNTKGRPPDKIINSPDEDYPETSDVEDIPDLDWI
tara:strand:+ start:69 stop:578 length:510 start_codon:yes stop_codon:yes gene_type:complete